MKKIISLLAITLFITLLLCSCGNNIMIENEQIVSDLYLNGTYKYGDINIKLNHLNGIDIRSFKTEPGKKYTINYEYTIDNGDFNIKFTDSNNNVLAQLPNGDAIKSTDENAKIQEVGGKQKIKSIDGTIKIIVSGKNASGKIKIEW